MQWYNVILCVDAVFDNVAMSLCLCHYSNGHLRIVEWLIKSGADIHSKDKDGETPLHWACQ